MSLERLGWNGYFEACWREYESSGCLPARVVSQQRGLWRVAGEFGECWAAPSGKLRQEVDAGGSLPAVGDWVAAEGCSSDERAILNGVLPRKSQFLRKAAGRRVEEQVIAANVDLAWVVVGLGSDFNLRRIERYLTQCWESGAKAIVVLNKADECGDVPARVAEAERIGMGVPILAVSAITGQGLDTLEPFLIVGETIVLLGSSGVGKSTLLNRLLGREAQMTWAVRKSDGRGRHTTTSRELFALPNGSLVIDTPGLRELQLWDAAEGVAQTFADIEELAARCRFGNCSHSEEPGCAVQEALATGELEPERLENRRKLEREQEFLRRKVDSEARRAEKQRTRALHRGTKQMYEQRRRDGGKE